MSDAAHGDQQGSRFLGAGLKGGFAQCGSWELISTPLQEKSVLIISEPSL